MKKTLIIIIGFVCCSLCLYSQKKQQELVRFVVLDANFNGVDYTDWALNNSNYFIFFLNEYNKLCFSNVTDGEQSYGLTSNIKHQEIEATETTYAADHYTFRWGYSNTYDKKKGSALVELIKIYKEQAVAFEIKMVTENMDVLIYKGYMEGSVNLEQYY